MSASLEMSWTLLQASVKLSSRAQSMCTRELALDFKTCVTYLTFTRKAEFKKDLGDKE